MNEVSEKAYRDYNQGNPECGHCENLIRIKNELFKVIEIYRKERRDLTMIMSMASESLEYNRNRIKDLETALNQKMDTAYLIKDDQIKLNEILRKRIANFNESLGQMHSMIDDCPLMSNRAKDIFEDHIKKTFDADEELEKKC